MLNANYLIFGTTRTTLYLCLVADLWIDDGIFLYWYVPGTGIILYVLLLLYLIICRRTEYYCYIEKSQKNSRHSDSNQGPTDNHGNHYSLSLYRAELCRDVLTTRTILYLCLVADLWILVADLWIDDGIFLYWYVPGTGIILYVLLLLYLIICRRTEYYCYIEKSQKNSRHSDSNQGPTDNHGNHYSLSLYRAELCRDENCPEILVSKVTKRQSVVLSP